jgi:hypothetical protein
MMMSKSSTGRSSNRVGRCWVRAIGDEHSVSQIGDFHLDFTYDGSWCWYRSHAGGYVTNARETAGNDTE